MTSVDDLCELFRAQGRRMTPQRRAIIQVLLESAGSHPTAEQIFTRVRDVMPDISHATVYNTLHELVEMGTLLELNLGMREQRYDINTTDHAHLICLGCGRVEDVPYDSEALTLSPEHTHGFQVVDCRVIFRGYCPACASQERHLRSSG
ncbi:MAG: transcriptional repressor [Chloroflexi bacterium]|nr:MAG: transcriptional repressor [Chloroflexota bacterium]